jgi:hypothetical protein
VFAELRGSAGRAHAHVDAVVTELELHDIASRRIDRCSTGMVAQLALARASIGDPALLIFDEPSRSRYCLPSLPLRSRGPSPCSPWRPVTTYAVRQGTLNQY